MAYPSLSLNHVGIYVADIDKMTEFYTSFFGLSVVEERTRWSMERFMAMPGESHYRIALVSGRKPVGLETCIQLSFQLEHIAALGKIHEAVKRDARITQSWTVNDGDTSRIYFKDPEGNVVECFVSHSRHFNTTSAEDEAPRNSESGDLSSANVKPNDGELSGSNGILETTSRPDQRGLSGEVFQLHEFSIFPLSRTIEQSGKQVELGSRAFDLLVTLLRRRGQIISKEEIFAAVWPSVIVSEGNLRFQMSALRRVLGDSAKLIRTVPSRGYMLAIEQGHSFCKQSRGTAALSRGQNAPFNDDLEPRVAFGSLYRS